MKKLLVVLAVSIIGHSQDIVFPENPGQRLDSKTKDDRVPVYAPQQCPENQLLYPGDQKNDWVCDCGPGFIYYPPRDGCFPAYRQGPCARGLHLVLKKSKIIPECATNPCQDGYARHKTRCYEMGKPNGPCKPYEEGGGIFDVNITTLVVECLKGTDTLSLFNIPKNCPPGSKRDSSNQCRENYNV